MQAYEQAVKWLDRGVATIPIKPGTKAPLVKWKAYQDKLPTENELKHWFVNSKYGLAVITGWQGLTVVDFDNLDAYQRWRYWAASYSDFASMVALSCYQVRTARGVHVYVRLPVATRTRPLFDKDGNKAGIDIKGRGGYVLAPPTVHPDGAIYTALDPDAMIMSTQALGEILPADLLELSSNTEQAGVKLPKRKLAGDPWGEANRADRPSTNLVTAIRAKHRIESFFGDMQHSGGAFYMVRCPLHDDHNPSMWVNTDLQICGCNAGCTPKPLDVINLYARIADVSNSDAIFTLAKTL